MKIFSYFFIFPQEKQPNYSISQCFILLLFAPGFCLMARTLCEGEFRLLRINQIKRRTRKLFNTFFGLFLLYATKYLMVMYYVFLVIMYFNTYLSTYNISYIIPMVVQSIWPKKWKDWIFTKRFYLFYEKSYWPYSWVIHPITMLVLLF